MTKPSSSTIPDVEVPGRWGSFQPSDPRAFGASRPGRHYGDHGPCLAERGRESASTWRGLILLALPALAVAVHSVAALYCVGVVGILLFWGRLRATRSWLQIMLMFCLFLGAWNIMGYAHAPDATLATIKEPVTWQWWALAVWFMVGLGFRIVGFRWISQSLKDPLSALVLTSVLGLLAFYLLLQFRDANESYGIYFLQSMFSIFAFSRLTSGCWHGVERSQMDLRSGSGWRKRAWSS